MNNEWHVPEPSIPIRQGDLIINRDPKKGQIQEICLVITADCDISKGKFGRQLACLRVILLHDYLRTTWASKKLQRALATETEKVRSQMAKWQSQHTGADSTLSPEAAISWIKGTDPELFAASCAFQKMP
jgi:hypothetical protein